MLNDVCGQVSNDTFKTLLKYVLLYRINASDPVSSITEAELQKIKQHPIASRILQEIWEENKHNESHAIYERLIKIGIAPMDKIKEYVRKYPRSASYIMGIGAQEKAALLKEAEEAEKEIERQQQEAANQTGAQNATSPAKTNKSLIQQLIDSGDIEHAPLSRAANGKYLDMALKIGEAMHLDTQIVKRWADIVQVYVIKNNKFEKKLADTKAPYYDTLVDTQFLGAFIPNFSKDENKNKRLPAIFLQEHKVNDQHESTMVFRTLNVPREVSIDAVMAHEIAHALNYIALHGDFVDKRNNSGNRARDYLGSLTEITARVYGELPIWRKAIFEQMDNLREDDLIKRAVLEEITENIMTHEAYVTFGGTNPLEEYARAERNEWPYYHTDNPIAAANKRVQRAKQKVMDILLMQGLQQRRRILLDILKKIKYYEEQINVAFEADSQDGMNAELANKYREELQKLHDMKIKALKGGYDLEIDSAIRSVITNFYLRNLKIIAETVNDPDWKPPVTLLNQDGEDVTPAYSSGTEPLSYGEIKSLAEQHDEWSQGYGGGGMTLEEPKKFDWIMGTQIPGYEKKYLEEIEPKYVERMSFNASRWRRTGRKCLST
jgi:hypothetical protein